MNSALKRFVVPSDGSRVINPATGAPLPNTGAIVDFDEFWMRRFNDGDVSVYESDPTVKTVIAQVKGATAAKEHSK